MGVLDIQINQKIAHSLMRRKIASLRYRLNTSIWKVANVIRNREDFHIIGHPKSGKTWLTVALSNLLQSKYKRDEASLIKTPNFLAPGFTNRPNLYIAHGGNTFNLVAGTPDFHPEKKNIILLTRDPRDIVASYYYQRSKRKSKFTGTLDEFIYDQETGIIKIIKYFNLVAEFRYKAKSFHRITYEEMSADMAGVLRRLCHIMNIDVSDEQITSAVEWTRFDKMRSREENDYYNSELPSVFNSKKNDPNAFKVRKGEVGSYRDELNEEQVAYINDQISVELNSYYAQYK
jgi:hypothetical protein